MVKTTAKPRRAASPAAELARVGVAGYLAYGDLWRRSSGIAARFVEQAASSAYRSAFERQPSDRSAPTLMGACQSCLVELMGALPLAAERFSLALAGPLRASLPGDEDTPPAATYMIKGKPVMLPARIQDAAQGLALFTVSADEAQGWLDEATGVAESQAKRGRFEVLRLKQNQTPLAVFMVDYRVSDLGEYHEIGVALFARPATDKAAIPGMFILELPVNGEFTREAGVTIWGYPKSLAELRFEYQERRVVCDFQRAGKGAKGSGEHVMTLTYARRGAGSSTRVPSYSYTLKDGVPNFTVFTRSGRGEQTVAGGDGFGLELGRADPLADRLRSLGLPKAPIMQAWTEHMSGAFGLPHPLP